MLPESKGDFPKLLYLDQNKWIDLARAHYGRPDGEPFMDALKAVRAATESGRLIAPFSMVNAVEAMIPRDAGRRERLARFMADLSGGRTVLPFPTVFRWEIRNAVHGLFGRPSPLPIRPLVVGAGLPHAIGQSVGFPGLDADTLSAARARLGSPAMTARLLIGVGEGRGLIDLIRERDEAVVGICTRLRGGAGADRGPEAERMAESWSLLFDGGPAAEVLEVAQRDLGFTLPELRAGWAPPRRSAGSPTASRPST